MEFRTPLKLKCMSHKYGGFEIDCQADIEDSIKAEWRDEQVYINPAFITSVTFGSVEIEDLRYNPYEVPNPSKRINKEEYFLVNLQNGACYMVRKKYWEQFYEDWTGVKKEGKV